MLLHTLVIMWCWGGADVRVDTDARGAGVGNVSKRVGLPLAEAIEGPGGTTGKAGAGAGSGRTSCASLDLGVAVGRSVDAASAGVPGTGGACVGV